MRLILSAFLTVDGVMEAPGFDEHRDGRNAWALRRQDPENEEWNFGQVMQADAILLGRTTYQIWAAFWPTAGDGEFVRRMNEIPKFVVSRTVSMTLGATGFEMSMMMPSPMQAPAAILRDG